MKIEVSLAKLNGKYYLAHAEYDDHTLDVTDGHHKTPKAACAAAAKALREAAIRFDALAEEDEPTNYKTHKRINSKGTPDDCTSTMCRELSCDHCRTCSHAIYRGSATISGHVVGWEFEPMFGYSFTGWYFRPGRQPGVGNAIWAHVQAWETARGL